MSINLCLRPLHTRQRRSADRLLRTLRRRSLNAINRSMRLRRVAIRRCTIGAGLLLLLRLLRRQLSRERWPLCYRLGILSRVLSRRHCAVERSSRLLGLLLLLLGAVLLRLVASSVLSVLVLELR